MSSNPLASAAVQPGFNERDDFHPLEIIPYFRRYEPGPYRDIVFTFIWNCGLALAFTAIGMMFYGGDLSAGAVGRSLLSNVIVTQVIGYTIHALFEIGHKLGIQPWARRKGKWISVFYFTGVATLGVVIGFALVALAFDPAAFKWILTPRWLAVMGLSSFVISVLLSAVFFARERQARTEAELERERLRGERVEREAALANLRALQAQIEPHFLFNTLANVTSLVDPDPAKAKAMLESFIQFLRASLAATRMESTTLGAEAELVAAYLHVLKVRMGERLRYVIDIPDDLRAAPIAPMLLQPVVENSIRHGLEPKVEGGEVAFRARREALGVVIEISDTGVGFASTTRGGVGLTNLRARLKLLYGERASLAISENAPAGAIVTIRIPA
jgi:sensor histidine kinase YesM